MSFTVCPAADFNSFAAIADADTFHAERGNEAWAALTLDQKRQHLIRATDRIQTSYVFSTQPWTDEGVEPMLVRATALLALYSITVDLAARGEARVTTSETLSDDGSTISKDYALRAGDPFPAVTNFLANLATLSPATGTARVKIGWML